MNTGKSQETSRSKYMAGLGRIPVLGKREEQAIAEEYVRTRDQSLAHRLVEGHLRLVIRTANQCCFHSDILPDLIQVGCLGLIKAVSKFDPSRHIRLSTYAEWWIRAHIFEYIAQNARVLRVVTTASHRKLFFSMRREALRLESEGKDSSAAALAEHMGVSESAIKDMDMRLGSRTVEIGKHAGKDSDIPSTATSPHDAFEAEEMRHAIRGKLAGFEQKLSNRERVILEERLCADEPITLQEIGTRFGLTRERARQIELRLKARLKPHLAPLLTSAFVCEQEQAA